MCVVSQEVYSKGIISTAFITNVTSVGELKFDVATNNRTFIFRAENEGLSISSVHLSVCKLIGCPVHVSFACINMHLCRFIYICTFVFYKSLLFIHVITLLSS